MYAFLYITLSDEQVAPIVSPTFFEQYQSLIIGIICGTLLIILMTMYIISRLIRYRDKYKAEKEELRVLHNRARELDEKAGGLGYADDEVVMMANPLVVEMKGLEEHIRQVNQLMNVQEMADKMEMASIERERSHLIDEINQVKALLHEATKTKKIVRVAQDDEAAFNMDDGFDGGDDSGFDDELDDEEDRLGLYKDNTVTKKKKENKFADPFSDDDDDGLGIRLADPSGGMGTQMQVTRTVKTTTTSYNMSSAFDDSDSDDMIGGNVNPAFMIDD